MEEGEIPLCFLFSGTVFYQAQDGGLQVAPISLDKQADFRPAGRRLEADDGPLLSAIPPGSALTATSSIASCATKPATACQPGNRRSKASWPAKLGRWRHEPGDRRQDRSGRALRRLQSLSLSALGQEPLPLDVRRPVPATYSEASRGTDAWSMQVQCLVQGEQGTPLWKSKCGSCTLRSARSACCRSLRRIARRKGARLRARRFVAAGLYEISKLAGGSEREVTIGPLELASHWAHRPSNPSLPLPAIAGTAPRPGRANRGGHRPRSGGNRGLRGDLQPNCWRNPFFDSPCGFSIHTVRKMPASRSRDEALMRSLVATACRPHRADREGSFR